MAQAFVSERVVTPNGIRAAAILEESGRIQALCGPVEIPPGYAVHDFGPLVLLPGLVDTHVHINEPGRTEWEGFRTATRAAAAGGITTLVDMPLNCLPETTNVAALQAKHAAAANQCLVDWAAWGGVAGDNALDVLPLAGAGVRGYKCFLIYPGCEGFQMVSLAQLEAALPFVASSGLPLLVHAELDDPVQTATAALKRANADWRRYATYLASRPDEAELEAIRILIDLCRRYRFRLHVVHLATAEALPMLRAAREEGLALTVETCPHYLHFVAEEIPDGSTLHKCAPPIRSRANCDRLWEALREGVIDLVATDHSPCPPEMKKLDEGRFDRAWGGIGSLAVSLPAMWMGAAERGFGLDDLVRWMATAPAQLAGLERRKGSIAAGSDCDLAVFDPDAVFFVSAEDLHTRHAVSPYVGETLRGRVEQTWLRGRCVYDRRRPELFAHNACGLVL